MIEELGVIDTRKIISVVSERHGIDLSNDSLTALRYRLTNVINSFQLRNVDDLCDKLKQPLFFERFIDNITVNDTEFFRDPSFWREFKSLIVKRITGDSIYKIWLPNCSSGEELYSLLIFLKEENLIDKVSIRASQFSQNKNQYIKAGVYNHTREDINSANYKRAQGGEAFNDYIVSNGKTFTIDTSLVEGVQFDTHKSVVGNVKEQYDLILYRNSLIYYNKSLQNDIVEFMHTCLRPSGLFVIGVKESLNILSPETKYRELSKAECIYQKIAR